MVSNGTAALHLCAMALDIKPGDKIITTPITFVASARSQIVEVPFVINTNDLQGSSIVAFETLFDGESAFEHCDIEDTDQTLTMPDIGTDASDTATGTHALGFVDEFDLKDIVTYSNLEPGIEYTVTGYIVDKATGMRLKDGSGNEITSCAVFTPASSDGSVEVLFEDVSIPLDVEDVVIFEYLTVEGVLICEHTDIEDEDQTLTRSYVVTTARSSDDLKTMRSDSIVTITDRVTYHGLEPGREYEIVATLYMRDGTPVMENGEIVSSDVTFTPEESEGVIEVPVKLSTRGMVEGDIVVVFENIYDRATEEEIETGVQTSDVEIARHNDLNCTDQSITVKNLPSTGEEISEHVMLAAVIALAGALGVTVFISKGRRTQGK